MSRSVDARSIVYRTRSYLSFTSARPFRSNAARQACWDEIWFHIFSGVPGRSRQKTHGHDPSVCVGWEKALPQGHKQGNPKYCSQSGGRIPAKPDNVYTRPRRYIGTGRELFCCYPFYPLTGNRALVTRKVAFTAIFYPRLCLIAAAKNLVNGRNSDGDIMKPLQLALHAPGPKLRFTRNSKIIFS